MVSGGGGSRERFCVVGGGGADIVCVAGRPSRRFHVG